MTLAPQVKFIVYGSLKCKKMAYFGEITGACSLSIPQSSGGQILVGIFSKAYIEYFVVRVDLSNR